MANNNSSIPEWAWELAGKLHRSESELNGGGALAAFARYIAAHEEPPVDPLLIEAREIAAECYTRRRFWNFADDTLSGCDDDAIGIQCALAALRRCRS